MSIKAPYYCFQAITGVAKLALEYRKILELDRIASDLEKQQIVTESLVSYSKLIKKDVQTLMHMYFKSAYENLNFAITSSGENRKAYLQQAKNRFIDAATIEKNENLIFTYLGLAICQASLDDTENCRITLNKIIDINCVLPESYEELTSMMPYNHQWYFFFREIMLDNMLKAFFHDFHSSHYSFTHVLREVSKFSKPEEKEHIEEYIKRRFNAIRANGGLTLNEQEMIKRDKNAMKQILQEDFESFKSEILSYF